MAAAVSFQTGVSGQYMSTDGWVWCRCGRRFGVYDQDGLINHIAWDNSKEKADGAAQ